MQAAVLAESHLSNVQPSQLNFRGGNKYNSVPERKVQKEFDAVKRNSAPMKLYGVVQGRHLSSSQKENAQPWQAGAAQQQQQQQQGQEQHSARLSDSQIQFASGAAIAGAQHLLARQVQEIPGRHSVVQEIRARQSLIRESSSSARVPQDSAAASSSTGARRFSAQPHSDGRLLRAGAEDQDELESSFCNKNFQAILLIVIFIGTIIVTAGIHSQKNQKVLSSGSDKISFQENVVPTYTNENVVPTYINENVVPTHTNENLFENPKPQTTTDQPTITIPIVDQTPVKVVEVHENQVLNDKTSTDKDSTIIPPKTEPEDSQSNDELDALIQGKKQVKKNSDLRLQALRREQEALEEQARRIADDKLQQVARDLCSSQRYTLSKLNHDIDASYKKPLRMYVHQSVTALLRKGRYVFTVFESETEEIVFQHSSDYSCQEFK